MHNKQPRQVRERNLKVLQLHIELHLGEDSLGVVRELNGISGGRRVEIAKLRRFGSANGCR